MVTIPNKNLQEQNRVNIQPIVENVFLKRSDDVILWVDTFCVLVALFCFLN